MGLFEKIHRPWSTLKWFDFTWVCQVRITRRFMCIHLFSASFKNGLNRSIGMGKRIVELFSAAIVFKVWR
jgi:hypothetical protein